MAMSGIEVDSGVIDLFNDMKLRKTNKWATFKISPDQKRVEVDVCGDPCVDTDKDEEKFKELVGKLTSEEPRYCLFDFNFVNKEGRKINKLAFIHWSDDNGPIKPKMKYASTKDTIKKAFSGLSLEFQANDRADIDYNAWRAEVEKKA